jgi:hypothetical protein
VALSKGNLYFRKCGEFNEYLLYLLKAYQLYKKSYVPRSDTCTFVGRVCEREKLLTNLSVHVTFTGAHVNCKLSLSLLGSVHLSTSFQSLIQSRPAGLLYKRISYRQTCNSDFSRCTVRTRWNSRCVEGLT